MKPAQVARRGEQLREPTGHADTDLESISAGVDVQPTGQGPRRGDGRAGRNDGGFPAGNAGGVRGVGDAQIGRHRLEGNRSVGAGQGGFRIEVDADAIEVGIELGERVGGEQKHEDGSSTLSFFMGAISWSCCVRDVSEKSTCPEFEPHRAMLCRLVNLDRLQKQPVEENHDYWNMVLTEPSSCRRCRRCRKRR